MHGDCELLVQISGFACGPDLFKTRAGATKSPRQRQILIGVAQAAQKSADRLSLALGFSDRTEGGRKSFFPGLHCLEEETFKFSAVARPILIDSAAAAFESGTRLGDPGIQARGTRATCCAAKPACSAQQLLAGESFTPPQFQVGKNNPIAAQSATNTEALLARCISIRSSQKHYQLNSSNRHRKPSGQVSPYLWWGLLAVAADVAPTGSRLYRRLATDKPHLQPH